MLLIVIFFHIYIFLSEPELEFIWELTYYEFYNCKL